MSEYFRFSIYFILIICLAYLCSPLIIKIVSAYNMSEDLNSIQQADDAISSAFEAVSKAENAGANVTNLIIRLNEAVSDLSNAKILLMNESSGDIIQLTEHSIEIAGAVKNDAQALQAEILLNRDYTFKITLIESLVSVAFFLIIITFLWSQFKSYYIHKIISLKPEVTENVET